MQQEKRTPSGRRPHPLLITAAKVQKGADVV
jgi:hypothetical protein